MGFELLRNLKFLNYLSSRKQGRIPNKIRKFKKLNKILTWVGSALVRMVAVRTSCVTTRCSWRWPVVMVVAVKVFSSIWEVVEFVSLSSLVNAVRVVTWVAFTCGTLCAWLPEESSSGRSAFKKKIKQNKRYRIRKIHVGRKIIGYWKKKEYKLNINK